MSMYGNTYDYDFNVDDLRRRLPARLEITELLIYFLKIWYLIWK